MRILPSLEYHLSQTCCRPLWKRLANEQTQVLHAADFLGVREELKVETSTRAIAGDHVVGDLSTHSRHDLTDRPDGIVPPLGNRLQLRRIKLVQISLPHVLEKQHHVVGAPHEGWYHEQRRSIVFDHQVRRRLA